MLEYIYDIRRRDAGRISKRLAVNGINSFYIDEMEGCSILRIYLDSPADIDSLLGLNAVSVSEADESAWLYRWADNYTGQAVTDDIYVIPPGIDRPPGEYRFIIVIDPYESFGDGHHPTTRLCSYLLEETIDRFKKPASLSFLDIGTGSGLLAVQAYMQGIRDIKFFDNDPPAVKKANENLTLNNINGYMAELADIYSFNTDKKYDVVTANLLSYLIEDNIEYMKSILKPEGSLILSGISDKWERYMIRLFTVKGFCIIKQKKIDEWNGFIIKIIYLS